MNKKRLCISSFTLYLSPLLFVEHRAGGRRLFVRLSLPNSFPSFAFVRFSVECGTGSTDLSLHTRRCQDEISVSP